MGFKNRGSHADGNADITLIQMTQNNKIKIFVFGCFAFGIFSLGIFLNPVNVFADTPLGGQCTGNSDCATGLFCDTSNVNNKTCESVTNTTPCITNDDCWTSKTGLVCINAKCATPTTSTGPGATNPPVVTPPTVSTGGSITCPDGLVKSANGVCLPPSEYTTGIAASTSLSGFIVSLIKILLTFAGMVAVVMLVIGGYWYMAAGGNEEMSEKGRKTILNFVMGLVIIILAYTIVSVIASTLTGADRLIQQ
jgi:uncharacterized membrane protein YwzB